MFLTSPQGFFPGTPSYFFNVASWSIYSQKLWNMVHDQIVQEDKAIQEELEKEVSRLDQREKELVQENARIKNQLAAAQEEKRMLLGRLHEIETQLNITSRPQIDDKAEFDDDSNSQP